MDDERIEPGAGSIVQVSDRFQILSLDGGGLRGIFAAAALARLEEDFGSRIIEHFDLIAGTSTGALIALALAAGKSPQDVVDMYLETSDKVFPRTRLGRFRRLRKPYDPTPLRSTIEKILGDRRLGDSPVRLVVPTFDLTSNDVYLFRTPHSDRFRRDHAETMVDVALAATAAPTFFPVHHLGGLRLVDGGVWANNPTMIGVVEALVTCGQRAESLHVLNIGTTSEVMHRSRRLDDSSLVWWVKEIVDVVLRGQALSAKNHAKLLLPKGHVFRIDVPVPKGLHRLDKVDAGDLIGNASAASRKASPDLPAFFAHQAPPYSVQDRA